MYHSIVHKVSQWPVSKIETVFIKLINKYLFLAWIGVTLLFYLYLMRQPSTWFTKIFTLFLVIVAVFIFFSRLVLEKSLTKILREELDMDKYLILLEKYNQQTLNGKVQYLPINLAYATVALYKGNFKDSLQYLSKMETHLSESKKHFKYRSGKLYLTVVNNIFLQKMEQAEALLADLTELPTKNVKQAREKEKYLERARAIYQIAALKESSAYFEKNANHDKLEDLESVYFQALASQNQGKTEQAKALFSEIAGEKADLYYVQQARKELGGGRNDK